MKRFKTTLITLTILLALFTNIGLFLNPVFASTTTLYEWNIQHTQNGLTAYILNETDDTTSSTLVSKNFGSEVTVYWASDVKIRHFNTSETSVASKVGEVSRSSDGSGIQSNTWACPAASVESGDALKVVVYIKLGGGSWQTGATFISRRIRHLNASTWTFYYYTSRTYTDDPVPQTSGAFRFGSTTHHSRIANVNVTFDDYELTIESQPTDVTFYINDTAYETEYSGIDNYGPLNITFPETYSAEGEFTFSHWEDGSTNNTRFYDLTENSSLTAYYDSVYAPIEFTGTEPVFECAMNNMFELNGILEGNDTYRQMLLDTSPYENHGKIYPITHPYAGPELTWGRIGKGLEFDGVDDTIIVSNSSTLNVTDAITIEYWFMTYNNSLTQKMLTKGSQIWQTGITYSNITTYLWTTSNNVYGGPHNITIETGVFYYFSLTYDYRDGYYTVYLHGVPQFNVTTDGNKIRTNAANTNIYIGSLTSNQHWFNGVIDEIRIFPYKRNYDEIYADARTAIREFDTWTFVNSGISVGDDNYTVIEGVTSTHQGFTNNDPELPWARANGTEDLYSHRSFVRTIKYVAGFQSYQLYCTLRFSATDIYGSTLSGVLWYWSFFKHGRLQASYSIEIGPEEWGGTYVQKWRIVFQRTTPYAGTVDMSKYVWNVNTTAPEYHNRTCPIIVSAWVGPDDKRFTVRVDVQDENSFSNDTGTLTHCYDLVDENLNPHITDWFDGWIVFGIRALAVLDIPYCSGCKYAKMEILSHKLSWLIPVIVVLSPIIGGIAAYYLYPQVQTVVHTVVEEVVNVLQPIAEVVGTAVKFVGEATADAIAGLAHDIIGGLGGLGALFSNLFEGLGNILADLSTSIWASLSGYSTPILTAIVLAAAGMGPLLITLIDGAFMMFGYPDAFSNFLSFLESLWGWLVTSVPYAVSMFGSWFTFLGSFAEKMLNTLSTGVGTFANMINTFWGVLEGAYGIGVNSWETIRLDLWVQLFFICYPIYLLYLWEEKGLDAVISHLLMVKDILAFMAHIFITVIQLFIRIISDLIEKVPVVE